eukprot:SM000097S24758  [mRNA]  locus=s97:24669:29420:- [translate_table: standard]
MAKCSEMTAVNGEDLDDGEIGCSQTLPSNTGRAPAYQYGDLDDGAGERLEEPACTADTGNDAQDDKLLSDSDSHPPHVKTISDVIHGHKIKLRGPSLVFTDTPQVQRLRHINQLGAVHYVFPSATHTRFAHSLGTSYLAGETVRLLKQHQPDLELDEFDSQAAELAGLCHDLGHGCFSHVFDGEVIPALDPQLTWKHEEMSTMLMDDAIDRNNLDIDDNILAMAKDMIMASTNTWRRTSTCTERKLFLYDIVANGKSGMDVDKFDYLARDSYYTNVRTSFDHERVMQMMRVVNGSICYRWSEATSIYSLFYSRAHLFETVYTHRVVKAIEYMIRDVLILADPIFNFREAIREPAKFCKFVNEFVVPEDYVLDYKKVTAEDILPYQTDEGRHRGLSADDIIVQNCNIDYGMGRENPVDKVGFYELVDGKQPRLLSVTRQQVSNRIADTCRDVKVRIFSKKGGNNGEEEAYNKAVGEAFERYQAKHFGKDLQIRRTPSKRLRKRVRTVSQNGISCSQFSLSSM